MIAAGLAAIVLLSKSDNKPAKPKIKPVSGGSVDFILKMFPHAVAANKVYKNVPPLLMLAFASLESGFGKKAPQYNFFGMKAGKNWKGKSQLFDTTEILPKASGYNFPKVYSVKPYAKKQGYYIWKVSDRFKAFDSPTEAFIEFAKLMNTTRYKSALNNKNIRDIIQGIKNAGYATATGYVDAMMNFVKKIVEILTAFKST